MTEVEVRDILKSKQSVIDNLSSCESEVIKSKLTLVMDNLAMIEEEFPYLITGMLGSSVRFSDYHSSYLNAEENINYFDENYGYADKEEQIKYYLLSSLLKDVSGLIFLVDEGEFSFNEIVGLSSDNFYDDLVVYSEKLRKKLEVEKMARQAIENSKMDFTREDNLYKILFTGFSYDDIKDLPKHVKMQVIKKLNGPLSTEKVIQLAEGVDHVRDAYDFPLQRIQVADDYRIAFVRRGDVTAILGVRLKSGKNSDYTRYDSIAQNADRVYAEIDEFSLGMMPHSEDHIKTIKIFQDVYDKNSGKGSLN